MKSSCTEHDSDNEDSTVRCEPSERAVRLIGAPLCDMHEATTPPNYQAQNNFED